MTEPDPPDPLRKSDHRPVTEPEPLRKSDYRPAPIPRIACKVRQDNSGLISRLALLEQRIASVELAKPAHQVAAPAPVQPTAADALAAPGLSTELGVAGGEAGGSSELLEAILARLEALENNDSESRERLENLENPAIDPLSDIKVRLSMLEEEPEDAQPPAVAAAPSTGAAPAPQAAAAAPGMSKKKVVSIVAPLVDDVRKSVGSLNGALLKVSKDASAGTAKALKQVESAVKQGTDCTKQLKLANGQIAQLKAEIAQMKVEMAVPPEPVDNSAVEAAMVAKQDQHAQRVSSSMDGVQLRLVALEDEVGIVPELAATVSMLLLRPDTSVAVASKEDVPAASPSTGQEPVAAGPIPNVSPVAAAASSPVPAAAAASSPVPAAAEGAAAEGNTTENSTASPSAAPASVSRASTAKSTKRPAGGAAKRSGGGLGARLAAIEAICGSLMPKPEIEAMQQELNNQLEEQRTVLLDALKQTQTDMGAQLQRLKKSRGAMGGEGGGVDPEELLLITESVEQLRERTQRSELLNQQLVSGVDRLTTEIQAQMSQKISAEEFKSGLYTVNQTLADANRELAKRCNQHEETQVAIWDNSKALDSVKSGVEALEAQLQLGGTTTHEDLAKMKRELKGEHVADHEQLRGNLQGIESKLDTKLQSLSNEVSQISRLTTLWGTMLKDPSVSDGGGSGPVASLSVDQRNVLSESLIDTRLERLEHDTRSLTESREESMALLRSTVGDLRDTKMRVTSLREISSNLAPKVDVERLKKFAESLRRMIKEKASAADVESNRQLAKRAAADLVEIQRGLSQVEAQVEVASSEQERKAIKSNDWVREIDNRLSDGLSKIDELELKIDEMPDPSIAEAFSNEWSDMVAERAGGANSISAGGAEGADAEGSKQLSDEMLKQLQANSEIDQRNFEKFSMWLTKHDKKLAALKDRLASQESQIKVVISHADTMQTQQMSSLGAKVDCFEHDIGLMRRQHMGLSFTVSMDRKVASRREERLLEFEKYARSAVSSCVQKTDFETRVAEVMTLKANAEELKQSRNEVDEQLESLFGKSRSADMLSEMVERLEPAMRFRAREVAPGYRGTTLAEHISVLLDGMSTQNRKLADVGTSVARLSAQQREVSAAKMMELVQDGIEVALTGLAEKVYDCVDISKRNERVTQDLSAAVLSMGLEPNEEAKLLDCTGASSKKHSSTAHRDVLQALYKQTGPFSTYQSKLVLLQQRKDTSVTDNLHNSEWLRMLNQTPEPQTLPSAVIEGGVLVRKLAEIQQEAPQSARADSKAPMQHKANSAELMEVAQRTTDLITASDGAIEELWHSVQDIEHKISHFATADVISHKVDRGELHHLLEEIVQAYERKLTGGDGDSLLSMSSADSATPNCALCSKPLNAFNAAVGDCLRHGKFPPRLPIKSEKTHVRSDRVELKTASGARVMLPKDLYDRKMYAVTAELSARKPSPRRGDRPSPRRGLAGTREFAHSMEQPIADYVEELPSIIQAQTHR